MEVPLPPGVQGLALGITHALLQLMKTDLVKINLLASHEKQLKEAYHFLIRT
jgi:prephenate dehydratase